jgi:hypothetical protein
LLSFIVTQAVICHGTVPITDDDEGNIFEDDEEEDEEYLFAGQGIVPNTDYLPKHPLLHLIFIFMFKCHFNRGIR